MKPVRGLIVFCAMALAGGASAADMIGFYAPWDAASVASLKDHGAALKAVVPTWISVTGPGHQITLAPDPAGRAALAALKPRPQLWLMVQNALMGAWDGQGAAALLHDKTASAALLGKFEAQAASDKASGLVVDFEDLPPAAQPDLLAFLTAARERCRRHGWTLAVTAPVANPDWNLPALGKAADRLILMAYDEHWQTGQPGPIASDPWFSSVVKRTVAQLPPGSAIAGVAAYAYDWPEGGAAAVLSIPQAEALAARNNVKPERDQASGAEHFAYTSGGVSHEVWMSDAAVVRRQIGIAEAAGAKTIALWRLGTEDPGVWAKPALPRSR
jgi:spore germination protein YaaH